LSFPFGCARETGGPDFRCGKTRILPADVSRESRNWVLISQLRQGELAMKSMFFSVFGIPATECKIEVRKDDQGVPRLWFRSTGGDQVGLNLISASQLRQLLTDFGQTKKAKEIGKHITRAQRLNGTSQVHRPTVIVASQDRASHAAARSSNWR
jgi:hypothetical protein